MNWLAAAIGLAVIAGWAVIACAVFMRRDRRELERVRREAQRVHAYYACLRKAWRPTHKDD